MKPRKPPPEQDDLLRARLVEMIDMRHELVKLAALIAIEPMIGHMKNDGRLTRCPLKGTTGDALFAVLCGCGHNIRMILRHLRAFLCQLVWLVALFRRITRGDRRHQER